MFILFNNVKLPSTETHFFSRGRGRVLILRRRLLQILSLRRGANSKQALISSWALIRTFTASYKTFSCVVSLSIFTSGAVY